MIGVRIKKSSRRQYLRICYECFIEIKEDIRFALESNLIDTPKAVKINECKLCFTTDKKSKSPTLRSNNVPKLKKQTPPNRKRKVCGD